MPELTIKQRWDKMDVREKRDTVRVAIAMSREINSESITDGTVIGSNHGDEAKLTILVGSPIYTTETTTFGQLLEQIGL